MIKNFKDIFACLFVIIIIFIEVLILYSLFFDSFAERENIQDMNIVIDNSKENTNLIANNTVANNTIIDNIILNEEVLLNNDVENEIGIQQIETKIESQVEPEIEPEVIISESGDEYSIIGTLKIDEINLEMPILSKTTQELMRISACRLWGPNPNQIGNLCIIGHNWRNTKLFSKVPNLDVGSIIEIIDLNQNVIQYRIYDKYLVYPENVDCLEQETDGRRMVTLITCNNDSTQRYVFHAEEL